MKNILMIALSTTLLMGCTTTNQLGTELGYVLTGNGGLNGQIAREKTERYRKIANSPLIEPRNTADPASYYMCMGETSTVNRALNCLTPRMKRELESKQKACPTCTLTMQDKLLKLEKAS